MYANREQLLTILPELQIIEMDTGLRINRVKELNQILKIHARQVEEHLKQKPGELKIEKKNRLSLYCAMQCFRRNNQFN